jgi:hypothetical protein
VIAFVGLIAVWLLMPETRDVAPEE